MSPESLPWTVDLQGFLELIQKTPTCWIWHGHRDKHGYGLLVWRGRSRTAHAVMWELTHDTAIPKRGEDGHLEVDHLCLNKSCVRPDHLEAVPKIENRRRVMKDSCRNGHLWTFESTRIYKNARYCRICDRGYKRSR